MATITRFPRETEAALRSRLSTPGDTAWVLNLAASSGWMQANRSYLGSMYQRGVEEMTALMNAADVTEQPTLEEALQLLETALSFWAPGATIRRRHSEKDEALLDIRVANCPTYARMEKADWHGVTACGNWHQRRGWYDALGVEAEDTLLREKKWGYEACVVRIRVRLSRGDTELASDDPRGQSLAAIAALAPGHHLAGSA